MTRCDRASPTSPDGGGILSHPLAHVWSRCWQKQRAAEPALAAAESIRAANEQTEQQQHAEVGFAGGDGSSRATGGQSSDELLQALMSAKNAMLQVTTATSGPSPASRRPPAGVAAPGG